MLAVLAGIVLVITAAVLWLGDVTTAHAVAIAIGVGGVLLLASGLPPAVKKWRE